MRNTPIIAFAVLALAGCFVDAPTMDEHFDLLARVEALEHQNELLNASLAERPTFCVSSGELDRTVHVPDEYPDLVAALDSLASCAIRPGQTVTIQLSGGTWSFNEPVTIEHPDGLQLRIVGDESDPSQVVLEFPTSDGLILPQGRHLGYLSGMTLQGPYPEDPVETTGLTLRGATSVTWGNLRIHDFNVGTGVANNASLLAADGSHVEVTGGGHGIVVAGSAFADLSRVVVDGCGGYGIMSFYGSVVVGNDISVVNCTGHGYLAVSNSLILGHTLVAQENGGRGLFSEFGSYIQAQGPSQIINNEGGPVWARTSSSAELWGTVSCEGGNCVISADELSFVDARNVGAGSELVGGAFTQSLVMLPGD